MAMVTVMATVTGTEMKSRPTGTRILLASLLLGVGPAVLAQQNTPGALPTPATNSGSTPTAGSTPASAVASTPAGAERDAQQVTLIPPWIVKPRIALTETMTDNASIGLAPGERRRDLITEVTPGLRIEARTARLKGFFDYSARQQIYAQYSEYNRTLNSLNTSSTLEAVDNWLYVDFYGTIAQQSISAFAPQSPSGTAVNANSTETSTYRVSPYLKGKLAGSVDYLLRYNASTTRTESNSAADLDLTQWIGQLRGSTPFRTLNWTLDANQQTTEYASGRKTDADQLRAMGTYALQSDFRVSLSGGRESNNYASLDQESHSTHGFGFDWTPTERTQLSVFKERRFFGNGHNISVSHRFPLSSILYTDSKDVSVLPNQFGIAGLGTAYELFSSLVAGQSPDLPAANRDALVNELLARNGLNPNMQVTSGFLSSRAMLQRRQQLSFALRGMRNTLTFMANRTESESMLAVPTGISDDFSNATLIRQQGISVNLAHRLSEVSNLNLLASRQESRSSGGTVEQRVTTRFYQVNVSTKLGPRTTGSLGARRTVFDSTVNPYSENAVIGSINFVY